MSASLRYWFTVRSTASGFWQSGWCFGQDIDTAARDALTQATRYHRAPKGAVSVSLQEVPNYGAASPANPYSVVYLSI